MLRNNIHILKTIILFTMIIYMLSGCSNSWKNQIDILSVKNDSGSAEIEIKNKTDKAYDIQLLVNSNNVKDDEYNCSDFIKPNETKTISCGFGDITDEKDEFEIKKVNLLDKEIPVLNEGTIDIETLEYHFENIYKYHTKFSMELYINHLVSIDEHPYITSITYKDKKVYILYQFSDEESNVSIIEAYSADFEDMEKIYVKIENPYDKIINNIQGYLSSPLFGLASDLDESYEIRDILQDVNTVGYTLNWKVNSELTKEDNNNTLYYALESRY